jgi:hypothetical protein
MTRKNAYVWLFGEERTVHPVFHLLGKYESLEDVYADGASGKAKQFSKCGLLLTLNPFAYGGVTRTLHFASHLRYDHASAIGRECRTCFHV